MSQMSDVIVYTLVRKAGADEDGSDKREVVVDAFLDKAVAHAEAKKDPTVEVKPIVVDVEEFRAEASMRLSAVERLFFKFEVPRPKAMRDVPR